MKCGIQRRAEGTEILNQLLNGTRLFLSIVLLWKGACLVEPLILRGACSYLTAGLGQGQ